MAMIQSCCFTLFRCFSGTKQVVTGCDIRFGVCITQVCYSTRVNVPRFRHPFWHLRKERAHYPEHLTSSNKDFIQEKIAEKYGQPTVVSGVQTYESPIKNVDKIKPVEWSPGIRRTATIAKKIGICPLWKKDGTAITATLLHIVDNHVIRYNPPDQVIPLRRRETIIKKKSLGKYGALIVGAESSDPQLFTKEYCGLFKDSGLPPKRKLARFLISPQAVLPVGTPLNVMHYRVNDYVDVTGQTIMRGFQGVIKRWGFKGMPATHGVTKTHRRPGNIGGGGEKGRVWPGKKLPGHMGGKHRTLRGLKILRINTEYNVLWVTGQNIPGDINSYVYIHDSLLRTKAAQDSSEAPLCPTYIPKSNDELIPKEFWAEDIHNFEDPSITYEITEDTPVKTGAKTARTGAKTAKLRI